MTTHDIKIINLGSPLIPRWRLTVDGVIVARAPYAYQLFPLQGSVRESGGCMNCMKTEMICTCCGEEITLNPLSIDSEICSECGYNPLSLTIECEHCAGTGRVYISPTGAPWDEYPMMCPVCEGEGRVEAPYLMVPVKSKQSI